ncbi:hypothetical protein Hanom_Chr16g01415261 [Helianthus anomalus]
MDATASAWYSPRIGYRPSSRGSTSDVNFLLSLNKGRACNHIIHYSLHYSCLKTYIINLI